MQCDLKCECGRVKGLALVRVTNKMEGKLQYKIQEGSFFVHRGLLVCSACEKPVLTDGSWK